MVRLSSQVVTFLNTLIGQVYIILNFLFMYSAIPKLIYSTVMQTSDD